MEGQPCTDKLTKEIRNLRAELQHQRDLNERHLRGLLDAVDQSVMLLEPDGTILECNRTFAQRLGYSREDLLGRDVYALLPPDIAQQRKQHVEKAGRLRSPVSFVDERWGRRFSHRVVPILDDRGNVLRFAVQGADITEQRRLAEDLQASNELLKTIQEAQSLFITEKNPRVVFDGLLKILVSATQSEYGFLDEVVCQDERPLFKRSLAISDISWDAPSRQLYRKLASADFAFPNLSNLAGAPALSGGIVIANDPAHDSRSHGVPDGHPPVRSFLGIPMRHHGEIVGVAGVANRPGGYAPEIAKFLEPLTSACAALIVALQAQRDTQKAKEILRRSENHFKLLYEQAPLAYQSLDAEGCFLEVNQAWLDLLGYSREEVLGRSFADFLTSEERREFQKRFPCFKESGEVKGVEIILVRKDGTKLSVSLDGRIARNQDGSFLQTHCILHDISAQKQHESLLLAERDLARALGKARDAHEVTCLAIEAAMNATGLECGGVYLLDADSATFYLQCHEGIHSEFVRAAESFGLDSEQVRMIAAGQLVQLEDEALVHSSFAPAVKEGIRTIIAVPIVHEEVTIGCINVGSRISRRIERSAIHALEAIAAQAGEALERTRSQEALRNSQAELKAIHDGSPVMMCVLDGRRRLLYMNRRMAEFVGKTEKEVRGQRACGFLGCIHALEDPRGCGHGRECETCSIRLAMLDAIQTGRGCRDVERQMTLVNDNGSREVVLRAAVEWIETDSGGNLLVLLEDITDRKRAEEALRESEQRVRAKLDAILEPDGDLGALELADIIDVPAIQALMDDFYRTTNIGVGIINLEGDILIATGWQEICTEFHRIHPETYKNCIESDTKLSMGVPPGSFKIYKCKNNMWDMATPIMIGGRHVGNLFLGQFLFEDEEPDAETIRARARQYGFDEEEYLAALLRVPRWSRRMTESVMSFYTRLTNLISSLSFSNLKLARSLEERKHLIRQLQDSESLLSQAEGIAGTGSFIWEVSSDSFISSSGMHRLFGFTSGDFPDNLHEIMCRLIHPQDRERVGEEVHRMVSERRAWPIELSITRADGEKRLVHCETRVNLDDTGQSARYVGTVCDITERRADENRIHVLQQQLNHVSRLAVMGELLAGVAHEVNQPLCAIVNFAKACQNVASREPVNLDQIREWTESIHVAATRAGETVRRMLHFARRQGPDWDLTTVGELIGGALLLVRHEAREHNVDLRVEWPGEEWTIPVKPGQIEQVLVNLLRNGIEALSTVSSRGRQIRIRMHRSAENVEISVADNGEGMAKEQLEKLFDPFFTTKPSGLGLGLAISRTIIEDHGGRIRAERNSTGGLTFRFTLPLEKPYQNDA